MHKVPDILPPSNKSEFKVRKRGKRIMGFQISGLLCGVWGINCWWALMFLDAEMDWRSPKSAWLRNQNPRQNGEGSWGEEEGRAVLHLSSKTTDKVLDKEAEGGICLPHHRGGHRGGWRLRRRLAVKISLAPASLSLPSPGTAGSVKVSLTGHGHFQQDRGRWTRQPHPHQWVEDRLGLPAPSQILSIPGVQWEVTPSHCVSLSPRAPL